MTHDFALEVTGISKAYGAIQALRDVSLGVRKGEIHALAGENGAGKSTLMNIIDGIVRPDAGEIRIRGEKVEIGSPARAQELGIGLVHQEIALCGGISVAENIFMAATNRRRSFFMNYGELREKARAILAELGSIDPDSLVGELTISEQQIVEIAKALTLDCSILILDEPTAALTEREAGKLFAIMAGLKARGISIIYISHRMAEIFAHCDRITVLRDGQHVSTDDIAAMTPESVVGKMVGRALGTLYPPKNPQSAQAPALMAVEGLSDGVRFKDISFELRRGEVLGVAGLIGAGRTEMALGICGLMPRSGGRIRLEGREVTPATYADSIANGIVYLSEDRKGSGVFLDLPIAANVSALDLGRVSTRLGFVDRAAEREQARCLGDLLRLRRGSLNDAVATLSGGNQQKVAIAKMLSVSPKVILLDEPTRGVDVGAKAEIHRILRELADQGTGIVVISSELPELIGLADRVIVIHEGGIAGEVTGTDMTEDRLIRLASGLSKDAGRAA
ncbi:D-xylose ABC transporter ATP-binding protein [Labrys okinawensis]|uniref:D-xylose ABC transporter ATP-binding protein n=1 Tax=Labrys okinawensis TaxID=346911 RepID=A0A2S9Q5V8_9HYPH|nr:sugar ABC transporter ATP-binding protein [Labrys okinawensis]PRH84743.1 D-xylose ABC transporter ATP-binding protein [Labrys okinawensis]